MNATKTYLEVLHPGLFFPEEETREVPSRDVDAAVASLPAGAFGFRFFSRTETSQDGEVLRGKPRDFSGYVYLGREYALEEVERQFPGDEHRTLRSNLRVNGWMRAVLCRTGNWRPLEPGDSVIPEGAPNLPPSGGEHR